MPNDSREDNRKIWGDAEAQLRAVADAKQRRELKICDSGPGPIVRVDGRELVNFSSNNYLDLATHPRVVEEAKKAVEKYGAGAGAARLVTGTLRVHSDLESQISEFKGAETALVFSSGYLANLGLVQALSKRADGSSVPVFFDRLAHASLVDAAMNCGSKWKSFPHNDSGALDAQLAKLGRSNGGPAALVLTESVFSMDGDLAPLPDLLRICEKHGALLIIDDAHGTGTIGPGGRGGFAHFGIGNSPLVVQMGTLSKALGSQGGFVAGPRVLIDLLVNRARAFIFDTALAPACAAAASEALRILDDEPDRLEALGRNVREFRSQVGLIDEIGADIPIVPIVFGSEERAVAASAQLRSKGFLVAAIRPPTVPRGTSRLRITIMSSHTQEQLSGLAMELKKIRENQR